jgi:acetyl-CoA carboxylase biotin carboxyl carrier protein
MTTSEQNQSQPHGGEHGTGAGTAAASQAESGGAERGGARHGRRRRSGGGGGGGGGRPEQQRPSQPRQPRSDSGLNMDELRELTELFSAHGLTDFEFENADIRIRLSRNPAPAAGSAHAAAPTPAPGSQAALQSAANVAASQGGAQATPAVNESPMTPPAATAAATEAPEEELHVITSPIVGTFYRAPSPQADSFVKVGSQVEMGTVVCIIEAMKLMNEIESDGVGTIAKIYVENGQPVEYGQPLFGVKK